MFKFIVLTAAIAMTSASLSFAAPASTLPTGGSDAEEQTDTNFDGVTSASPESVEGLSPSSTILESFETDCHTVQVYRQAGQVMMRVRSNLTSELCSTTSGDQPAHQEIARSGAEYWWDNGEGITFRAFVSNQGEPSVLSILKRGVVTSVEYEVAANSSE